MIISNIKALLFLYKSVIPRGISPEFTLHFVVMNFRYIDEKKEIS